MLTNGEISERRGGRRLSRLLVRVCAATVLSAAVLGQTQVAAAEERSLTLYNAHTKERATIVYKRNGRYDRAGLKKLDRFMRDWRRNEPIKMDPKLYDVLWQVYEDTGANRPITVICGYRSPQTNAMLRKRSKGVAQNSQHTKGKAIDFYIPGVNLSTLRAAGLRLQAGGVGFYPSSGSPFVHMDTGSVRHWPRMSRSQLVKVFPNGKTLHVPTDGKPLPGYSQALAAYKVRQATGKAVASTSGPIEVADADIPLPRSAPERLALPAVADVIQASATGASGKAGDTSPFLSYPPESSAPIDGEGFAGRFAADAPAAQLDPMAVAILATAFETAHAEPAAAAPANLRTAMSERQEPTGARSATASLPIKPTAVVSTVDVGADLNRPLRADAITTAVLRGNEDRVDEAVPTVLAYASASSTPRPADRSAANGITAKGVPLPQSNPTRTAGIEPAPAPLDPPVAAAPKQKTADDVYGGLLQAELTLTKLDTQGLRLWIATPSTREKRYALLTMPDYSRTVPALLGKPDTTFATRFGPEYRVTLRTDRFDGAVAPSPAVVDLTSDQTLAAR